MNLSKRPAGGDGSRPGQSRRETPQKECTGWFPEGTRPRDWGSGSNPERAAGADARLRKDPIGERRVLIVGDERGFAESLADILQTQGYNVCVTQGSSEVQKILDSFNPHCALVDISAGTVNGIDPLTRTKVIQPDLPCILVTAHAGAGRSVEALGREAFDCLNKPVNTGTLLAALDRCFSMVSLREDRDNACEALRMRSEELAEVNSRLRRLTESARALASCRDAEELSRKLLEELARILAADGGSMYTVHDSGLGLVHCLGEGEVPDWIGFPLPRRSVFDRVLRDRETLLVREINEEDLSPNGGARYRNGSLFALPLLNQDGRVLAAISLHNKKQPPFTPQDGEVGQVMITLSAEILRSQQVSEWVRISLREKDVLLREVHHRVKNNLQIISGLLNLQALNVEDDQARHIYESSQGRINTLALLHEKIFQTRDLTNVPFARFVEDLTGNLMKVYGPKDNQIRMDLEVEDIKLAVDTAIPCGLIISELLSNALKYAFPGSRQGAIRVEFARVKNGSFRLIISDDGVGLPHGFELSGARSMGLQLVNILSEQLGSETTLTCDPGASFTFIFKEYLEAGTAMY